jgi:hypothetical protein
LAVGELEFSCSPDAFYLDRSNCDLQLISPFSITHTRYINHERHVIEYIAFVTISFLVIRILTPMLSKYPQKNVSNLNPPLHIKVLTFIMYSCQLSYKLQGYEGKILFMLMPCNVLWTMWAVLCFWPKLSSQTMHIMYQLIIPYSALAIVAVATPDTSDLVMWGEVPFFFLMHYMLIAYPISCLRRGQISMLPMPGSNDSIVSNFLKWWVLACAYFALFYFGVAVPLSVKFGLNINYMMHPPPNPGDMVSGPNFRLQSTLCCAAAFFFVQFLATVGEFFAKAAGTRYGKTKNM